MANIQTEHRTTTVAPSFRPRPRAQYWDHRTASWQVVNPIPAPRRA